MRNLELESEIDIIQSVIRMSQCRETSQSCSRMAFASFVYDSVSILSCYKPKRCSLQRSRPFKINRERIEVTLLLLMTRFWSA
jgi:hypothetical protein